MHQYLSEEMLRRWCVLSGLDCGLRREEHKKHEVTFVVREEKHFVCGKWFCKVVKQAT